MDYTFETIRNTINKNKSYTPPIFNYYHCNSRQPKGWKIFESTNSQTTKPFFYNFTVLMNVSYLVLCSPDKVIDTGVVLLEKSGMVIVDRSVVRRLSLILFSSITVISKFTEC